MNLKPTTQSLSYEQFTAKLEEKIKPVIEFFAGNSKNFPGTGDKGVRGDTDEKYVSVIDDGKDTVTVHYANEEAIRVTMLIDGKEVEQTLNEEDSKEVMTHFVNTCNKLHGEKSVVDQLDEVLLNSDDPKLRAVASLAKATAAVITAKADESGKTPLEFLFENILKN